MCEGAAVTLCLMDAELTGDRTLVASLEKPAGLPSGCVYVFGTSGRGLASGRIEEGGGGAKLGGRSKQRPYSVPFMQQSRAELYSRERRGETGRFRAWSTAVQAQPSP